MQATRDTYYEGHRRAHCKSSRTSTRHGALAAANGIVSTIVVLLRSLKLPDPATASAILSNARALIKEHILRL